MAVTVNDLAATQKTFVAGACIGGNSRRALVLESAGLQQERRLACDQFIITFHTRCTHSAIALPDQMQEVQ